MFHSPHHQVHSGTYCLFRCNSTAGGTIICERNGQWNIDPDTMECEGGVTPTRATTPTQPTSSSTQEHSTRPTVHPTVPTETSTFPTTSGPSNCPFNRTMTRTRYRSRSVYCPESYCPAVYVSSHGGAALHQPASLGCFDYEGSLLGDEYPNYVNPDGRFLTPDGYSNPVIGYTVWYVSDQVLDTNGTIRNNRHSDQYCPYDLHDGWEYRDKYTGQWLEDKTLTVKCV